MSTLSRENEVLQVLSDLVHLDYDAIEAYEVAIARLSDPTASSRLREFRADHERHVRELGECIVELGGTPPRQGDARGILTQGKVYLGALVGTNAILRAMRSNEDDTNEAYEKAIDDTRDFPNQRIRDVLERGLEDERRHRAWIVSQLS